jgi:energy-coupling factor transport system substrate-specific component
MVGTKDIVVVAISAALYVIFTLFSSIFVAAPGFSYIFFGTIWIALLPIWFGVPGIIGGFIGSFLGAAVIQGAGFLGIISAFGVLIGFILMYVAIPAGVGEMKKLKHLVVFEVVQIIMIIVVPAIIFAINIFLGFLPAEVAWLIYIPTETINIPLWVIVSPIIARAIYPYLKRSGLYYGTLWDRISKNE